MEDEVCVSDLHKMNEDDPPTQTPCEKKTSVRKRNWRIKKASKSEIDLQPKELFPDPEQNEIREQGCESDEDQKSKDKGTYKDPWILEDICLL